MVHPVGGLAFDPNLAGGSDDPTREAWLSLGAPSEREVRLLTGRDAFLPGELADIAALARSYAVHKGCWLKLAMLWRLARFPRGSVASA